MITPADLSTAANPASAPATKSQKSAAAAASDFQNFLSLLTAQLRNQDPLSPLDSTQFVEQLATFSSVEQQIETNRLLEELIGGAGNSGLESATSLIGKEVEAEAEAARFAGQPLEFAIPARAGATSSEIVVRTAAGAVVYREPVGAGQTRFTWKGVDSSGNETPQGDYKFKVDYSLDGAVVGTGALRTTARVTEARLVDGALRLVLENGSLVDPATVSAVRIGAE